MKDLLFALSIFGSFLYGFSAVGKLIKNQGVTSGHLYILSASVTAMITHFLGMW